MVSVRWTRGLQTDVLGPRDLEHTERTSNNALTTCHFWSDVLTCSVVVCAERREQSPTTSTCVTYVYKYMSKPHCVVSICPHCPAKWHAQARMLSRALPDGRRTCHRRSHLRACCCHAAKVDLRCCNSLRMGCAMLVRHRREPGVHVEAGPV